MSLFKDIYLHIKYSRILNKIYKDEDFLDKLSKLLNLRTKVKKDWVGRLYTVLNPNLLPVEEQIFEYDENGLNNKSFVEAWVMKRFIVISEFIRANNLFDLLTYDIKKLDKYDNYLLILEPITWYGCKQGLKKLGFCLLSIMLIIIIFLILKHFFII